jgi:hypothetical protein
MLQHQNGGVGLSSRGDALRTMCWKAANVPDEALRRTIADSLAGLPPSGAAVCILDRSRMSPCTSRFTGLLASHLHSGRKFSN